VLCKFLSYFSGQPFNFMCRILIQTKILTESRSSPEIDPSSSLWQTVIKSVTSMLLNRLLPLRVDDILSLNSNHLKKINTHLNCEKVIFSNIL
jgi:hypothetical protein